MFFGKTSQSTFFAYSAQNLSLATGHIEELNALA